MLLLSLRQSLSCTRRHPVGLPSSSTQSKSPCLGQSDEQQHVGNLWPADQHWRSRWRSSWNRKPSTLSSTAASITSATPAPKGREVEVYQKQKKPLWDPLYINLNILELWGNMCSTLTTIPFCHSTPSTTVPTSRKSPGRLLKRFGNGEVIVENCLGGPKDYNY